MKTRRTHRSTPKLRVEVVRSTDAFDFDGWLRPLLRELIEEERRALAQDRAA